MNTTEMAVLTETLAQVHTELPWPIQHGIVCYDSRMSALMIRAVNALPSLLADSEALEAAEARVAELETERASITPARLQALIEQVWTELPDKLRERLRDSYYQCGLAQKRVAELEAEKKDAFKRGAEAMREAALEACDDVYDETHHREMLAVQWVNEITNQIKTLPLPAYPAAETATTATPAPTMRATVDMRSNYAGSWIGNRDGEDSG